jgi:hypothetical protein
MVEIEVEQKVIWCIWLKKCFSNWDYKIINIYIYILILILMIFNLNIVQLITIITSWNKLYWYQIFFIIPLNYVQCYYIRNLSNN